MVLPDTSIWIAFFRDPEDPLGDHLDTLIDADKVAICGPVLAELLAGANEPQREAILATVGDLPWAELDHGGWRAVGALAARLRREGRPLPLTDLQIAVAAAAGAHLLWSLDVDFERIAAALEPLELYRRPA